MEAPKIGKNPAAPCGEGEMRLRWGVVVNAGVCSAIAGGSSAIAGWGVEGSGI